MVCGYLARQRLFWRRGGDGDGDACSVILACWTNTESIDQNKQSHPEISNPNLYIYNDFKHKKVLIVFIQLRADAACQTCCNGDVTIAMCSASKLGLDSKLLWRWARIRTFSVSIGGGGERAVTWRLRAELYCSSCLVAPFFKLWDFFDSVPLFSLSLFSLLS